jgi:hypothetical protein
MRELRKEKEELNMYLIQQLENNGAFTNIRIEVKLFLIQMYCESMIDCTTPTFVG